MDGLKRQFTISGVAIRYVLVGRKKHRECCNCGEDPQLGSRGAAGCTNTLLSIGHRSFVGIENNSKSKGSHCYFDFNPPEKESRSEKLWTMLDKRKLCIERSPRLREKRSRDSSSTSYLRYNVRPITVTACHRAQTKRTVSTPRSPPSSYPPSKASHLYPPVAHPSPPSPWHTTR
jgi:hypothetical protein